MLMLCIIAGLGRLENLSDDYQAAIKAANGIEALQVLPPLNHAACFAHPDPQCALNWTSKIPQLLVHTQAPACCLLTVIFNFIRPWHTPKAHCSVGCWQRPRSPDKLLLLCCAGHLLPARQPDGQGCSSPGRACPHLLCGQGSPEQGSAAVGC